MSRGAFISATYTYKRLLLSPRLHPHFITGMENSAPSFTPEGQRLVTVFHSLFQLGAIFVEAEKPWPSTPT